MDYKLKNKKSVINIIIGILFLAASFFSAFQIIKVISIENPSAVSSSNILKINMEAYDKIANPADFGDDVSLDEPGFGKDNPFSPF